MNLPVPATQAPMRIEKAGFSLARFANTHQLHGISSSSVAICITYERIIHRCHYGFWHKRYWFSEKLPVRSTLSGMTFAADALACQPRPMKPKTMRQRRRAMPVSPLRYTRHARSGVWVAAYHLKRFAFAKTSTLPGIPEFQRPGRPMTKSNSRESQYRSTRCFSTAGPLAPSQAK
jgi:hypothetical protein